MDVNVLAYPLIPGRYTKHAEQVLEADAHGVLPWLWRGELRNVLATGLRSGLIELADAAQRFQRAKVIIGAEEYEVETSDELRLSQRSKCSANDCEYVALAEFLAVKLVTADAGLAKAYAQWAQLLSDA